MGSNIFMSEVESLVFLRLNTSSGAVGSTIPGEIFFVIDVECDVTRIEVQWRCVESSDEIPESETINQTFLIPGSRLMPGVYCIPFRLMIPAECPVSCENSAGHIDHFLHVSLYINNKASSHNYTYLKVHGNNVHSLPLIHNEKIELRRFFMDKGSFSLDVKFDKRSFKFNEPVSMTLSLNNTTSVDIETLKFCLQRCDRFCVKKQNMNVNNRTSTYFGKCAVDVNVPPGSMKQFTVTIEPKPSPSDTYTSTPSSKGLTVSSEWSVAVCVAGLLNSHEDIEIPIYLEDIFIPCSAREKLEKMDDFFVSEKCAKAKKLQSFTLFPMKIPQELLDSASPEMHLPLPKNDGSVLIFGGETILESISIPEGVTSSVDEGVQVNVLENFMIPLTQKMPCTKKWKGDARGFIILIPETHINSPAAYDAKENLPHIEMSNLKNR
eukprot:GDKJ01023878.1.p1 GENE.GDKJ01023878.1~~GDKJ01023878.1.p1  ORF type:complete len:437 (-),score=79.21 GDKJ01023878.1:101-1411(-)